MKNYEKYAGEIRKYEAEELCDEFIKPHILKKDSCDGVTCEKCSMLQMLWLVEEYKEPETDWSKVEVDTPILVRDYESQEWEARHFAKYEDGVIYAWSGGVTSWTAYNNGFTEWKCAKLAESEEE